MTFRADARIFSTNFFLDNYFRTEGVEIKMESKDYLLIGIIEIVTHK